MEANVTNRASEIDTAPETPAAKIDSTGPKMKPLGMPAMLTDALMIAVVLAGYKCGAIDKDMAQFVIGAVLGASFGSRIPARSNGGGPPDIGGVGTIVALLGSLANMVRK